MNNTKSWFKSKAVWLGIITISVGVLAVFETNFPTIGWVAIAKGVLDVLLRFATTTPIE